MRIFTKSVKGSISLFLSMIILMLVILEGFLIDGSKVLAAKMFMSEAGELSLNAGLTYYEEALRDIYGLFATSETEEDLTANLKIHFQKTLGEAAGTEDAGYVDSMLSYIDAAIKEGWDGEETGRLIGLSLDSFDAKGVPESQLAEPYVLKSQILEYMKYRGPASLGYGMLEKLYAFKELDKQQKTMENKLSYEEKMSDVQEACEDAYENIDPYNKLLEGSLSPKKMESTSLEINKNIRQSVIATWCYSAAGQDYQYDKDWRQETATRNRNVLGAIRRCHNMNSMSVAYRAADSALNSDISKHPYGTMCAIKVTIGYQENYDNYGNLYTVWQNYQDYYEKQMEKLEKRMDKAKTDKAEAAIQRSMDRLDKERERYEKAYNEAEKMIDQFTEILDKARKVLKNDIDTGMASAVRDINQIATDAKKLQQLGNYGKDALDQVMSAMDQLEGLGSNWQSSISDLSSGDIKTSMQLDYANKAQMLDREKITALQEKLSNGIAYGELLFQAADGTMAVGYKMHGGDKNSYAEWLRMRLEGSPYGSDTLANSEMHYNGFSVDFWTNCAKNTPLLSDAAYTVYMVGPDGGKANGPNMQLDLAAYSSNIDNISAAKDDFFKYLERVCPKSEADKKAKKDAEEAKHKLFDEGKSQNSQPKDALPNLAADVTGASRGAKASFKETDGRAKDKNIAENAKANTRSSAEFTSSVGKLLEKGRDKLYLSQYAIDMFSYYTVDKMKASDQMTLSGYKMNQANDQMYRAEAEYILWGNSSGKADVQYTLATIFGIRFLLNSLYAFTGDAEIREISLALAVSIAGWTGFGVPLVQSVVILGFALAETAHDMKALKNGESVPIYKSASNWCIKPSGYTKQEIINAVSSAGNSAKSYLFEQLDNLTEATKEEFRGRLKKYTEDATEDVVGIATAAVLNPLQERIIGLVNVVSQSEGEVSREIADSISGVRRAIEEETDSVMRDAKLAAVDYFQAHCQKKMVEVIMGVQNSEKSNAEIIKDINNNFIRFRIDMQKKAKAAVKPVVENLSGAVEAALDSGNEAMQEKTSEALDHMLIRINCGISFADTSSVDVNGAKGRTSGSAALTMNYKEYLWLFIAVKSVHNEDEMLKRMGNLIQANLASSQTAPAPNFNITRAYTFIELNATADLSTTFFALPVPVNGGGGVSLGRDKYSIGYQGVMGY